MLRLKETRDAVASISQNGINFEWALRQPELSGAWLTQFGTKRATLVFNTAKHCLCLNNGGKGSYRNKAFHCHRQYLKESYRLLLSIFFT